MKFRRVVFQIHLYVGLVVGLLGSLTGLTGSLLVFSHELDAALYPRLLRTAAPAAGAVRASPQAVWEAVRSAYPELEAQSLLPPREPDGTYEIRLKGGCRAFVDPYTGRVLGLRSATDHPFGLLFSLHTELLNGDQGKSVVGVGGLLLLLLGGTGVALWWPGKRGFRQGFRVQWRGSWKRVNFDLHRVTGVLAVLFLSLIAGTGAAMVWSTQVTDWTAALTATAKRPKLAVRPAPGAAACSLDRLVERASAALPGAEVTRISVAAKATAPVVVRLKLPQELHPNGTSFVHLDPYSGQVLRVENALRSPFGTRLLDLRYPLHVGQYGGPLIRALYVVVGLTPGFLFVTGCLMWWNRTWAGKVAR